MLGLFQFINSAKNILCLAHVNISVGYIPASEIAGSRSVLRFSLLDTADDQFSKVIIKTMYIPTGRY